MSNPGLFGLVGRAVSTGVKSNCCLGVDDDGDVKTSRTLSTTKSLKLRPERVCDILCVNGERSG